MNLKKLMGDLRLAAEDGYDRLALNLFVGWVEGSPKAKEIIKAYGAAWCDCNKAEAEVVGEDGRKFVSKESLHATFPSVVPNPQVATSRPIVKVAQVNTTRHITVKDNNYSRECQVKGFRGPLVHVESVGDGPTRWMKLVKMQDIDAADHAYVESLLENFPS